LDRNERIRLMGQFRALARGSWVAKAKRKHRGVVTRTAEAVFEALMYLTEKYGRSDQSVLIVAGMLRSAPVFGIEARSACDLRLVERL
jgi:hypothetical protein